MTPFQWLSVSVLVLLAAFELLTIARDKSVFSMACLRLCAWVCAAYLISRPSIADTIARMLKIGRGADLILYLTVLFVLIAFFCCFAQMQSLQRQLTALIRRDAIGGATRGGRRTCNAEASANVGRE